MQKNKKNFRVLIYKSNMHLYAQIMERGGSIISSVSTLKAKIRIDNRPKLEIFIGDLIEFIKTRDIASNFYFDCGNSTFKGNIKIIEERLRDVGVLT